MAEDDRGALCVEQRQVSQLIPYARNPRKNDQSVELIAASIREFGWTQPIVCDPNGTIIAGHTRLKAARLLGLKTVPVYTPKNWTDAQAKAYRIADNKLAERSEWDVDLLKLEIGELADLGVDGLALGFDENELAALSVDPTEGLTDPDAVPDAPEEPVTQPGDVWTLGRHRLVCGDSTGADDVAKALNGIAPHLMVTDPPYGVAYDANWRSAPGSAGPHAEGTKRNRSAAYGKVEHDDKADWREAWALFPGDVAYVWCASLQNHIVAESLIASGYELRSQIIWDKGHIAISRGHYHWQHEPCWYVVRGGAKGHWKGDRKQSTIWNIDKPRKSETGHSTQKPVECMKRPIENNSSPGQAVYDPFLGSGTTLIAAEMTGRACHGLELNPAYCDVIVDRWQKFTGERGVNETENAREIRAE